jgi:Tol biopolymer transport system component
VHSPRSFRSLALVALFAFAVPAAAQFYAGSQQEYGKNRVQYQEFLWSQYRFKDMEVFFYKEGRDLARYVAQVATAYRRELEREFDFTIDDRLQFIVYNSLSDFRQSNIGLAGIEGDNNIGGMTRIVGTKIFVYFEGDHTLLDQQVRSGIAHVIIDQMMFGGNWREMVRSATFMSLPAWFTDGIISYHGHPWDATLNNRVRDGVLSGRYDKLHRLRGDDARMAGHAIWKYVADVYGPGVIPNILYMTRVSRNPESGFLFVLGVSLKTLTKECMAYYRSRFGDEDRVRQDMPVDPLPIRTKKRRQYGQFRQSPDGQHLAWVSNEMGQYKVWTYEIATGKVRRIAKGEKKLERIQDLSFPVIAWHPSGQALTYAVERKGQLYLRTYTLEDRKTTVKPVFMLKKILSMDYSPDGRNMVFSAVREGRTDLYYYYVIGNRQEQLTDDQYDDLHPRFSKDGRHIIFSSDRTSDTLRANADVALVNGAKDVFLFDLRTRSQKLTRLTSTPEVNETWPADRGDGTYVFLSDADGIVNRMLARRDSAISHIDTIVHYRYTTVVEPMTDLRRSILEQNVVPERRSFTQVQFVNGRYRFHQGRLDNGVRAQRPGEGEAAPVTLGPAGIGDLRPVVKVDPQVPRPKGEDAVDPRNYVFLDENQPSPAAQHPTQPTVPHAVASAPGDTVAPAPFAYPELQHQLHPGPGGDAGGQQFQQPVLPALHRALLAQSGPQRAHAPRCHGPFRGLPPDRRCTLFAGPQQQRLPAGLREREEPPGQAIDAPAAGLPRPHPERRAQGAHPPCALPGELAFQRTGERARQCDVPQRPLCAAGHRSPEPYRTQRERPPHRRAPRIHLRQLAPAEPQPVDRMEVEGFRRVLPAAQCGAQ